MIRSKQDLVDWALRANGAPVVNIEVDEDQLADIVEQAVQFYQQEHFEGIERDYVKLQVTADDLTNGYFLMPDPVFSVIRVVNTSSVMTSTDSLFNLEYQIMAGEMQRITSEGMSYLYSIRNYMANLDFVLRREKTFRFNSKMNRLFVDVNWDATFKVGDWVVLEVYKAVDPEVYSEVYNDLWLKKYTAALVKRQWGTNTSKYGNMTLPGGLTFNGQQKYEEAVAEIKDLEEEARSAGAPLSFMIG